MDRADTRRRGPLAALRRVVGTRVYGLLDRAVGARLRLEVEARVEQEVQARVEQEVEARVEQEVQARVEQVVARALDERLPAVERQVALAQERARTSTLLSEPLIFGPPERVRIAATAVVNDALLNTTSGSISVDADAFFGHRVCVLTGSHDIALRGRARQLAVPDAGRDIHVEEGAWIGTGAIVLGPCRIGAHAVVAAGAVVTGDVAPATLVAGVPARMVRSLE